MNDMEWWIYYRDQYRFVGAAWDAEVWQGPGGAAERNHSARTMKGADVEVNKRHLCRCCWWWTWCCSRSAGLREEKSGLMQGDARITSTWEDELKPVPVEGPGALCPGAAHTLRNWGSEPCGSWLSCGPTSALPREVKLDDLWQCVRAVVELSMCIADGSLLLPNFTQIYIADNLNLNATGKGIPEDVLRWS